MLEQKLVLPLPKNCCQWTIPPIRVSTRFKGHFKDKIRKFQQAPLRFLIYKDQHLFWYSVETINISLFNKKTMLALNKLAKLVKLT